MLKVSHICKTFTGGIIRKTRVNAVKDVSLRSGTGRHSESSGIPAVESPRSPTCCSPDQAGFRHHRDRWNDPDHLPTPGNILRSGKKIGYSLKNRCSSTRCMTKPGEKFAGQRAVGSGGSRRRTSGPLSAPDQRR